MSVLLAPSKRHPRYHLTDTPSTWLCFPRIPIIHKNNFFRTPLLRCGFQSDGVSTMIHKRQISSFSDTNLDTQKHVHVHEHVHICLNNFFEKKKQTQTQAHTQTQTTLMIHRQTLPDTDTCTDTPHRHTQTHTPDCGKSFVQSVVCTALSARVHT